MAVCSIPECGEAAKARGWCFRHYNAWRYHGDASHKLKAKNGEPVGWIVEHSSFAGDACLIWPYGRAGKGYACRVWPNGTKLPGILACRYMCQIANGPPPSSDHEAAHSCGNGTEGCIHPKHLRWATPAENESDKAIHGTKLIGADNPTAKLTAAAVRTIRRTNVSQQRLADKFGVSRNAIRQVLDGRTWGHVQ